MNLTRYRPGGGRIRIATETDKRKRPEHVRRASHVEPVFWLPRVLFHLIRKCVRDESRAAEWTRHWPVVWQARVFAGPTLGPYEDRQAAIAAEVEWLEDNVVRGDRTTDEQRETRPAGNPGVRVRPRREDPPGQLQPGS